jgi:hypothetical protein
VPWYPESSFVKDQKNLYDTNRKDVLAHELQHAVQAYENFAPGSNPEGLQFVMGDIFENLYKEDPARASKLAESYTKMSDAERQRMWWNLYARHAGETESRNTEFRRELTADDRRMLPPWVTQDIPDDKQIVPYYWDDKLKGMEGIE